MTTGKPEKAVEVTPLSPVTALLRAHFDVVLPMGALLEPSHCGDGLGLAAIDGEHVLFNAWRHFPEDVPV